MNTKARFIIHFRVLAAALLAAACTTTHAASLTWLGTTDANWSTGSNWSGSGAPANGDNVVFTGGSNLSTNNNLSGLTLSNTAAGGYSLLIQSTPAVTVGGNQLTIGTGAGAEIGLYGGNHTISADLKLTDVSTFVAFSGTQTISGVISGNVGSGGSDEVVFRGNSDTDRLILSGLNTYTSFTTILNRGIFQVNKLGNANEAGSLGKAPYSDGDIRAGILDWNATIDYVGTGDSTDRRIRIGDYDQAAHTGSVSLLSNGSGALVWTAATLNRYLPGFDVLANRVVTLGGANTANNEIQSIITNNKATGGGTGFSDTQGTIGITKTGAGRWILSGNNTYTGSNTISAGTLIAANANALGSTYAGTTVSSGASLGLQGGITTAAEALSINGVGDSSAGALRNISGSNTYAGDVALAGNSTIGADAGSLTVSGAVTGTGQALTVVGGGSVTLSNASNTFGSGLTGLSRGLIVDGGKLVNGINNAVNSNVLVQVKSGTWDLNGYNQTVRSEWGGGVLLGNAAGSSAPTINTGTGTLTIVGEAGSSAQARLDYGSAGNPLGGVVNGNVAYSSPVDIFVVVAGPSTNATIDLTVNAVISKVGGGGGGYFIKGDTGSVLLNGLNTFNVASPRVDDGTLILGVNDPANGSAGALGQGTAQVTVGFGGAGNGNGSLLLRDGVTSARSVRTMNNTTAGKEGVTRTLGGYDSTGSSTFSGRIELFNASTDGGMTRFQALGSSTVAFSGVIVDDTNATPVGINKLGSGKVVLSGADTYRGPTTISAGTLQIGSGGTSGAIGSTSGVSVASGATLAFNRSDAYGGNFTRLISGSGSVVVSSGSLTLQNTGNTFTGGYTVDGGVLRSLGASITPSNTVTVNNGGTFGMAGTDTWGNAAIVSTPAITINAGGSLTTDGQFNTIRNLTLNGGAVNLNGGLASAGALVLGGTVTAGGATTSTIAATGGANNFIRLGRETVLGGVTEFNVSNASGQLSVGAVLADNFGSSTAGLTKTGPGTMVLSGNNTYTAATTVSAGRLLVNGTNAGTGGTTVDAGALLGGSGLINGLVTVSGTLSPGNSPGLLTLSSLALNSSATTVMEINGVTRGSQYDGIDLTTSGGLTYAGALSIAFGLGSAVADNTTFDLFNFSGTPSGDFASVVSTGGIYAGTWQQVSSGTWSLAAGSQTLTFSTASGDIIVVPEPGALALAGLGIAAAGWMIRRRR